MNRMKLNFFNTVSIWMLLSLLLSACQAGGSPTNLKGTVTPAMNNTPTWTPIPTEVPIPTLTPTPQSLAHLQVTPEVLKETRIRFWHPLAGNAADQLDQLVKDFNRQNEWGVQVDVTDTGSSGMLYSMLKNNLDGKARPIVILAPLEQLYELSGDSNVLINLSDYISDPQWGWSKSVIENFIPEFWRQEQQNNRQIGIPAQRNVQVLFYNVALAQDLGFTSAPLTPKEFEEQACAAAKANLHDKDKKNDGTGGWVIDTDPLTTLSWMNTFGLKSLDLGDGKITFSQPESESAFYYLRKLEDAGCAWSSREPVPYEYFATRQALFYSGTLMELPIQDNANLRLKSTDRWTVIPFPNEKGDAFVLTTGLSYSILVASPAEQLAAWLFIRWLADPDREARLVSASSAWPVTKAGLDKLSGYRKDNPQWGQTVIWMRNARSVPLLAEWRTAGTILEDAAWQLYQTNIKPDQIPGILKTLDATVPEILKNKR
jgi:multiple sugar transport system substrate-binding protein